MRRQLGCRGDTGKRVPKGRLESHYHASPSQPGRNSWQRRRGDQLEQEGVRDKTPGKAHEADFVGIQSCSAGDNSAVRDGRLGWFHSYFRLSKYSRTSPPPRYIKQPSNQVTFPLYPSYLSIDFALPRLE